MSIFISGSVAYDTVLSFEGAFADHLLANNLHELNVTFQTPRMLKNFGGCAGNIAYGLQMLGAKPFIASAWGEDARDYEKHFEHFGITTRGILRVPNHYTAQALITTDRLGNQLTAFHEGAMAFAADAHADGEPLEMGVITPMDTHVMRTHVKYLNARNVPILLDIGQASAYLSGEDMRWLIEHVDILTMSNYEWLVLLQKTHWSQETVLSKVDALVVTQAEKGATLWLPNGTEFHINALPISHFKSPVGCGDAFRSGLVAGLALKLGWEKSMRLATLMGAIKAEVDTPQGYRFTIEEIETRYAQVWNESLELTH